MHHHHTKARRGATSRAAWARFLCLGALAGAATVAQAVDVDAGDYTALPAGTDLGLVYYQHAHRDRLYSGGHRVPVDGGLDSDVGIARGVHFMDIGGYIVDPQFLLPFGQLKGRGDLAPSLGSGSGAGDLILAATVWLTKPSDKTHFGITPFVYVPTGSYDHDKALNLGENRWKFALQAGFITPLTESVTLDLAADATVNGKNDDYGAARQTMRQDALYQVQGFLRYSLSPAADLRFGLSEVAGGETRVDGVAQGNRQSTSKFSLGGAWFVAPRTQLMANYGRDISVRDGFKEANRINLRLLQLF